MSFGSELKEFVSAYKTGSDIGEQSLMRKERNANKDLDEKYRQEKMKSDNDYRERALASTDAYRRDSLELRRQQGGGGYGDDTFTDRLYGGGGAGASQTAAKDLPQEARALLDTIADTESGGKYDAIYGGGHMTGYGDHPRRDIPIQDGPNKGKTSSAAGRYQFIGSTWDEAKNALGLKDFSPENQDRAAWWLAQRDYKKNTGRDLTSDLKDPAMRGRVGAGLKGTWTSLPGGIESGTTGDRFSTAFDSHFKRYNAPATGTQTAQAAPTGALPIAPTTTSAAPAAAEPSYGTQGTVGTTGTTGLEEEDEELAANPAEGMASGGRVGALNLASGGLVSDKEKEANDLTETGTAELQGAREAAQRQQKSRGEDVSQWGNEAKRPGFGSKEQGDYSGVNLGQAVHDGIMYMTNKFGLNGGVPNPQGEAAFNAGTGAADHEELAAVHKAVDPQNKMKPAQRNEKAIEAVHTHYKNDPEKAGAAVASLMQAQKQIGSSFAGEAATALQGGDVQGAVNWLKQAYDQIPNGMHFDAKVLPGGNIQYTQTDSSGKVLQQGIADSNQLMQIAKQAQSGGVYNQAMIHLATEGRKSRQPTPGALPIEGQAPQDANVPPPGNSTTGTATPTQAGVTTPPDTSDGGTIKEVYQQDTGTPGEGGSPSTPRNPTGIVTQPQTAQTSTGRGVAPGAGAATPSDQVGEALPPTTPDQATGVTTGALPIPPARPAAPAPAPAPAPSGTTPQVTPGVTTPSASAPPTPSGPLQGNSGGDTISAQSGTPQGAPQGAPAAPPAPPPPQADPQAVEDMVETAMHGNKPQAPGPTGALPVTSGAAAVQAERGLRGEAVAPKPGETTGSTASPTGGIVAPTRGAIPVQKQFDEPMPPTYEDEVQRVQPSNPKQRAAVREYADKRLAEWKTRKAAFDMDQNNQRKEAIDAENKRLTEVGANNRTRAQIEARASMVAHQEKMANARTEYQAQAAKDLAQKQIDAQDHREAMIPPLSQNDKTAIAGVLAPSMSENFKLYFKDPKTLEPIKDTEQAEKVFGKPTVKRIEQLGVHLSHANARTGMTEELATDAAMRLASIDSEHPERLPYKEVGKDAAGNSIIDIQGLGKVRIGEHELSYLENLRKTMTKHQEAVNAAVRLAEDKKKQPGAIDDFKKSLHTEAGEWLNKPAGEAVGEIYKKGADAIGGMSLEGTAQTLQKGYEGVREAIKRIGEGNTAKASEPPPPPPSAGALPIERRPEMVGD